MDSKFSRILRRSPVAHSRTRTFANMGDQFKLSEQELMRLDVETRQALEAKLGEDVWSWVTTTAEGRGMELWRRLRAELNPSTCGSATAIEQQLMKLPLMTTPDSIMQGLVQFNHYVDERCRKADENSQLAERTKIIALCALLPKTSRTS